MIKFFFLYILLSGLYCSWAFGSPLGLQKLKTWKQKSGGSYESRLEKLYEIYWDDLILESPEFSTLQGETGSNHLLSDNSLSHLRELDRETFVWNKEIQKLSEKGLGKSALVNLRLFKKTLEESYKKSQFPADLMPITQFRGFQTFIPRLLSSAPTTSIKDFEDRILRIKALPLYVDNLILTLREGMAQKITPPAELMQKVPQQIDPLLNSDLTQNPLFQSLENENNLNNDEFGKVKEKAKSSIQTSAIPAFKKLRDFLISEYIPNCRKTVGYSDLPKGIEWYQFLVENYTSTQMKAHQIHELGLQQIEETQKQVQELMQKTGFKGNLKSFYSFLKTDKKFLFTNSEDLLNQYRIRVAKVEPELIKLFWPLPRLPFVIKSMPEAVAKAGPAAYFVPGNFKALRPSSIEVNSFDLASRPNWEIDVIFLHEAIPGHHLQNALAQENEAYPEFRRNAMYFAYSEGWGLYAESLGEKLGLYQDNYSQFGRLSYSLLRSIRLVVDTGIHSKGWTRDEAISFFKKSSALPETQIINEVDRYIALPGQALSYKLGELKITELKKRAEDILKENFDIRKFHNTILEIGPVPLDVLDQQLNEWIKQQKKSASTGKSGRL